jgi:tetratricopeptide (TPR) repeat protein
MTCDDVARGDVVEQYLHDRLSGESCEAFEEHYFSCDRCFRILQAHREIEAQLARTWNVPSAGRTRSRVWQWAWMPAAAGVMLAVGLAIWQRPSAGPGVSTDAVPSPGAAPDGAVVQQTPSTSTLLAELALVQPPPYVPMRVRGAGDEATTRFQEGMTEYERGNYGAAAATLGAASKLDPEAPHILFFLGISQLMAAQTDSAIQTLGETVALGESPYQEEAYFFLAKAYLQKGSVALAREALDRVVRMRGSRKTEAEQLLVRLEGVEEASRRR